MRSLRDGEVQKSSMERKSKIDPSQEKVGNGTLYIFGTQLLLRTLEISGNILQRFTVLIKLVILFQLPREVFGKIGRRCLPERLFKIYTTYV